MVVFLICPNGFCNLGLQTEFWFLKLAFNNGHIVTRVIFISFFLFNSSSTLMLGKSLRIIFLIH